MCWMRSTSLARSVSLYFGSLVVIRLKRNCVDKTVKSNVNVLKTVSFYGWGLRALKAFNLKVSCVELLCVAGAVCSCKLSGYSQWNEFGESKWFLIGEYCF